MWFDHKQKETVSYFFMGFNYSFSTVHGHILTLESIPSISNICSLVIQEEHQRSIDHIVILVILYIQESIIHDISRNKRGPGIGKSIY